MANLTGFDANQIEPNKPFEAIPAGWYKAVISESEMKPTKAGDGEYLELTLQVIEGLHEGRNQWDRLNLKNKNEQAVEIARRTLSAICRAVGRMTPNDSAELHNIPLMIKVGMKEYEGEMRNEVKGYKAVEGVGSQAPQLSQAAPSAPTAAPKAAPWAKR